MQLCREIRFALTNNYSPTISNSWSGWPSTNQIAPNLRLQCTIEGPVDEQTGYICNIKEIDQLLRDSITQKVIPDFTPGTHVESVLLQIHEFCDANWNSEITIKKHTLVLSPCLRYSIQSSDPNMIELTQQFEFSASHRLHCDHLSDEENRAIFGKCNNIAGHGHNYVVEVSVCGTVGDDAGQVVPLHDFEAVVKAKVIDVFDHKNLNEDIKIFKTLNPSVENITKSIWDLLVDQFKDAKLNRIRVYETPKTWAEYSGTQ